MHTLHLTDTENQALRSLLVERSALMLRAGAHRGTAGDVVATLVRKLDAALDQEHVERRRVEEAAECTSTRHVEELDHVEEMR